MRYVFAHVLCGFVKEIWFLPNVQNDFQCKREIKNSIIKLNKYNSTNFYTLDKT